MSAPRLAAPGLPGRLPEPDPQARARSDRLVERIREHIAAAGGWIGFDDYMQLALYEPGLGYYDSQGPKFGVQGDFVTAPEISPLFARALATQVAQGLAGLPAQVMEFGAGTGALALELLGEMDRRGTPLGQYFIVEVSADLRERQRERLHGLPVTWLARLPETFEGVIIANEVLDVLPVQLFVRSGEGALARGVTWSGNGLRLAAGTADTPLRQAVAAIEAVAGPLPEGYGSEFCPLAQGWIAALAACLRRGLILLADYGFPRREYYHPQRAMGTVMCHYRQHAHADPLWLPGLNDITAHVDFTAVAQAARAAELDLLGYTSQAHFLMNCGILELLASDLAAPQIAGVQRLLSEAEMGELVKVMALGRGCADALVGFTRGDRRHRL